MADSEQNYFDEYDFPANYEYKGSHLDKTWVKEKPWLLW